MSIAGRRRGRDRGQSLVEFALVFPILMILLIAIFDLGRLVFAYNDITNAARQGARTAIVDQGGTNAQDKVINQATSLGLTAADVQIAYFESDTTTPCPPPRDLGCIVEVTVTFDWSAITPIIGNIVGPISITTESRMPLERIFP